MTQAKRINQICSVLSHYTQLSANEFKRVICNDLKLMSHQTFWNSINEALDEGRLIKKETIDGKLKKSFYSINLDLDKIESDRIKYFEIRIKLFDKLIATYMKKLRKLDKDVNGEIIAYFYKYLDSMLFNSKMFSRIYFKHSTKFKDIIKKLEHRREHVDEAFFGYSYKTVKEEYKIFNEDIDLDMELHHYIMSHFFGESEESIVKLDKLLSEIK